jgi:hypothetical protein
LKQIESKGYLTYDTRKLYTKKENNKQHLSFWAIFSFAEKADVSFWSTRYDHERK